MSDATKRAKKEAADARRLARCLNEVVDDYARGIIAAAMRRVPGKAWQDGKRVASLLGEFIRDEATAFGDRLHSRITEILEEGAKREREQEQQ